jgi:hypothetical protein
MYDTLAVTHSACKFLSLKFCKHFFSLPILILSLIHYTDLALFGITFYAMNHRLLQCYYRFQFIITVEFFGHYLLQEVYGT